MSRKENSPDDDDRDFDRWLGSRLTVPPAENREDPAEFRNEVWRRIEHAELPASAVEFRRPQGMLAAWINRIAEVLARPWGAIGATACTIVLGLSLGLLVPIDHRHSTTETASSTPASEAVYARSISPFLHTASMSRPDPGR